MTAYHTRGVAITLLSAVLVLTACGPSADAVKAANDRTAADAAQQQAAADRAAAEAAASQAAADRAAAEKAAIEAGAVKAAADKSLVDAQAALKAATVTASAAPGSSAAPAQPAAVVPIAPSVPTVAPFVQISGSGYGFVSAQVGPVIGPGLNPTCTAYETYGLDGGGFVLSSSHNGGTWTWQFSIVRWTRVAGVQGKNTVTCKWDDGATRSASAFFPY